MYTLLIADDEPLIRNGVKKIIDWESREFDSCILEKVVAGIDLPAFFVSNFMFYLVVISGNSIENMIY